MEQIDFIHGKYKKEYAIKHGIKSLASSKFNLSKDISEEKMYQMALQNGKTWQEIIGYKQNESVLL